MVSKAEMLKAITKDKLVSTAKKKKVEVAKSWPKEKIADALSYDNLRKLYKEVTAKKPVKKKTTSAKRAVKKVVKKKTVKKPVKKKTAKRTSKRR